MHRTPQSLETGAMIVAPQARLVRGDRKHLLGWLVILVAIAVRVGWAAWIADAHPAAVTKGGDTASYLGPARALIEHGRFSLSPQNDTPIFFRTPGYPIFLAAILWLTNSVWSISPIQAALSVFTVVGVVVVGRRTIGPTAGLLAGVLVALDPLQFAASGTILTESLASLVVVGIAAAGAAVFIRPPENVQVRAVVALGALIAAATMVRPTTYYFPAVVVVLLVVRFRHLPRRSMLPLIMAFLLPIVVVAGGWVVRNHDAVNSWQVSGAQAAALYCWHGAAVEARATGEGIRAARERLQCEPGGFDLAAVCPSWWACQARRPLADGPSWDEMGRRGTKILVQHPVQTAEVMVKGLVREVAGPGTEKVSRYLHIRSSLPLVALLALWNALLWLLALVGAVVGLRSSHRWFWGFVISLVVYVVVVSAGAVAESRMRAPLVPLLALLAALGTRHIVKSLRGNRSSANLVA
jgi:hypothetical protein